MEILQNEITGTQTRFYTNFGGKLRFIPSFLFPEQLHWCFIYFHCSTCTSTINTLEPCALNAEFQHFIPRFNKLSLLCGSIERQIGRAREGYFADNFIVILSFILDLFFLHNFVNNEV
jgi:hypothetical protein